MNNFINVLIKVLDKYCNVQNILSQQNSLNEENVSQVDCDVTNKQCMTVPCHSNESIMVKDDNTKFMS